MDEEFIYLDHAAATPLDERVLEVMQPYFSKQFYNPSSPYRQAVEIRRDYEAAKQRLANCIGGKGGELVITAGATESINLMFGSVSGHVVTASIEHQSVLAAARLHDHTLVGVDNKGRVDPTSIEQAIRPDTELVSVGLANSEIGTIQPLRAIAEIVIAERRRRQSNGETVPIYFHTDASQGLGQLDVHVARLGVDALTANAGKVYGPKQVGLLWTNPFVVLRPNIVGGGQERGLRSGTENVAGVIGFAEAMEMAVSRKNAESKRLSELRDGLEKSLIEAFPDAVLSGARGKRLPGHLHISFPGVDAERLIFLLENSGVMVATGSACAANKGTRSHVLEAIGLDPLVADGSLRITLGRLNNSEAMTRATDIIVKAIKSERARIGFS
ncbi:MAG: cysteine desulfurase family protein [Candidatus Saccharimonas sp.]